ncbi:MAG: cysteine desulfurase family protein [Holosporales bacterium]
MTERAYLDYNATAPLYPSVRAAVVRAWDSIGNPSSVHKDGTQARKIVEKAREKLAFLFGVPTKAVLFTSGGTEANNTVLSSFHDTTTFISAIEHDSVTRAATQALVLPVNHQGVVDLSKAEAILAAASAGRKFVSVMLANNETGVIQPLKELALLCQGFNAILHTDATQGFGRIPLGDIAHQVDIVTLCAHKVGGGLGVGAIVTLKSEGIQPLLHGGMQENRRRAGTENVPALAGLAAFLDEYSTVLKNSAHLQEYRDYLEASLPEAIIYGANVQRLPNTSCLGMPNVSAQTQVSFFDLEGISVSAGAACASGKVTASRVLEAMGVAPDAAGQAVRVSTGWNTTRDDVDRFIAAWRTLYARTTQRRAA